MSDHSEGEEGGRLMGGTDEKRMERQETRWHLSLWRGYGRAGLVSQEPGRSIVGPRLAAEVFLVRRD